MSYRGIPKLTNEQPKNTDGVVIVLDTWARLLRHAPDRAKLKQSLTTPTGVGLSVQELSTCV